MTKYEHNNIVVVDDTDTIIGAMNYLDAVASEAIKRSSRVFVFNDTGQILLQRRSQHVSHPLLLDLSAGGYVDEGEEYSTAAYRELEEELGIRGVPLIQVVTSFREVGCFASIYVTKVTDDTQIFTNEYETAEWFWIGVPELDALFAQKQHEFTYSFIETWSRERATIVQSYDLFTV